MATSFLPPLAWLLLTGACWATRFPAAGQQAPAKRTPGATASRPTFFPDTLHARPLEVTYRTSAELDTLRASLGTTPQERWEMVLDSTARYRVFRGDDYRSLRLFYRPVAFSGRWLEVDLNPWLQEYTGELSYLKAYAIELDQRAPEEIMVKMGGCNCGAGYRTMVDQTLLLSLNGPPRLLWQSVDGRVEEIPPRKRDKDGEMLGGQYADYHRTVAMRQGRVYVSKVQKVGKFSNPDPGLTPITPGYYQYEAGHFRRVAAPPKVLKPPKPQPVG